jgi:hypothetical protein
MKRYFAFLTFVSLAASTAWAQRALAPPQVGFIQDSRGEVRPVNGLAGNFLVGGAAASGVFSASYSGSFGLLKLASALMVIDQQGRTIASVDAPAGPALFAFSADGSPALAYFEQSRALRVWDGHAFQPGPNINQDVLSIASLSSTLGALIVQRGDDLWELSFELSTGGIASQTALPGIASPMLLLAGGGFVYRDAQGVVVRHVDGSDKHIAAHLPAKLAFGQMGTGWIQVTDLATGRLFAMNVQPGHEGYYILPEVRQ